jgi:hypothetical protein
MNFCPHCGSAVGVTDTRCPKCGRVLAGPDDKLDAAALNRSLKKTVIGVIGPAAATPIRTSSPRPPSKPTLVGMPAVSPTGQMSGNGTEANADKASSESSLQASQVGVGLRSGASSGSLEAAMARGGPKTMIGLPAPVDTSGRPLQALRAKQGQPPQMKTMLGMTTPETGAATAQGVAAAGAEAFAAMPPPLPTDEPLPNADNLPIPIAIAPHGPRQPQWAPPIDTSRSYQSAGIAIGGGLVLATVAAAFALFWRSPAPLHAEARVDSSGTDILHMTCATCPDGTVLRIGTTRATVATESADLPLATPLKVGDNVFSVDVDRPSNGRDETVPLVVKIGYRIRPDPSQLDSDLPKLRVVVDGAPLATVIMGGEKLALGPEGTANYDVDVSSECAGLADESKTIERSIPYSVGASSGGAEQGMVSLRVAVPPLRIDSPGARATVATDHVQLAGRTGRGARLTLGDQLVGVAADGTFSRSFSLPTVGTTDVRLRAQLPGQATRVATLHIKRVTNLADEARDFAAQSHLSFAALMQDIASHNGEPVTLTGEVVDARAQGARTLALVDVKGCAVSPCLARVITGDDLARGDAVTVYGYVNGSVSQGDAGAAVAEIEAAFITKNH